MRIEVPVPWPRPLEVVDEAFRHLTPFASSMGLEWNRTRRGENRLTLLQGDQVVADIYLRAAPPRIVFLLDDRHDERMVRKKLAEFGNHVLGWLRSIEDGALARWQHQDDFLAVSVVEDLDNRIEPFTGESLREIAFEGGTVPVYLDFLRCRRCDAIYTRHSLEQTHWRCLRDGCRDDLPMDDLEILTPGAQRRHSFGPRGALREA